MREAGLLKRRTKPDVGDIYSGSNRHSERLDAAIEVLVVKRVLVVPDAGSWIGNFVTHEPDTIVSRIRLELSHCRTVHAMIPGCSRTVAPEALKLKG